MTDANRGGIGSLSVVIPCYNEAALIERQIRAYYAEAERLCPDFEVIVVDGNSRDGTLEAVRHLADELSRIKVLVQPEDSRGHGRALLLGYAAASKDWVFQVDSDAQFDPSDMRRLADRAADSVFVCGVRARRDDPLPRLFLTRAVRLALLLLGGAGLRDANCPFRLVRGAVLRELLPFVPADSVAPNIALSLLAKDRGFAVAEVEVSHRARSSGTEVPRQRFLRLALKGFLQLARLSPVRDRLLLLASVFLAVLIQRIPSLAEPFGRDIGGYAYGAWRVLSGQVLYAEIWDHKPPLIYFLYAAVMKAGGARMAALAAFEIAWLTLAGLLCHSFMRKYFGRGASFLGAVLFAVYASSLDISESFGMTEVYSSAAGFAAVFAALACAGRRSLVFLSGLLLATAFLFRQTGLAAAPPAVLAVILHRMSGKDGLKALWADAGAMLAGFALPVVAFVFYFDAKGALGDAYSQVFAYNFAYSNSSASTATGAASAAMKMFFTSPLRDWPLLPALALSGFVLAFRDTGKCGVNLVMGLWLMLGLLSVAYSGRFYGHYYLELFPQMAFFACFSLSALLSLGGRGGVILLSLFLLASPFLKGAVTSALCAGGRYSSQSGPADRRPLAAWLQKNSTAEDSVYFWGAESGINFITQRRSPARYHFLYPLITPGYGSPADVDAFISDLRKARPKYIVDCGRAAGNVPPLDFDFPANPAASADGYVWAPVAPAAAYILSAYEPCAQVGAWRVYRLRQSPS